ncbi:MAG: PIN domain-containing protein [Gemmatimonadota bacterium]
MSVFVDTNVLVYARDASEPEKQPVAMNWLDALWEAREGRLSVQVLQEFYVTVTAKLDPGLPAGQARADVRRLQVWDPLSVDASLLEDSWQIQDRYSFSLWDAAIVAAARRLGCRYLLTEDLQAGQDLDGMLVLDPFGTRPEEVVGDGSA